MCFSVDAILERSVDLPFASYATEVVEDITGGQRITRTRYTWRQPLNVTVETNLNDEPAHVEP